MWFKLNSFYFVELAPPPKGPASAQDVCSQLPCSEGSSYNSFYQYRDGQNIANLQ
eukprot:Pgem_evm1s17241